MKTLPSRSVNFDDRNVMANPNIERIGNLLVDATRFIMRYRGENAFYDMEPTEIIRDISDHIFTSGRLFALVAKDRQIMALGTGRVVDHQTGVFHVSNVVALKRCYLVDLIRQVKKQYPFVKECTFHRHKQPSLRSMTVKQIKERL